METEIVFCERCGVSIPEGDVARSRQASGGRDLCQNCLGPGTEASGDLKLYFCENCRVSIAVSDVLTGSAKPEGAGYLCAVCSRSTPAERVARRTAVEREMAGAADLAGAAAGARAGAAPLYFCDACNASIPAALVATGRALVQSGRTFCEACRPRVEAYRSRVRPGVGAAPALAAALLAATATAAGFVAWERWRAAEDAGKAAATAGDGLAEVQREVRRSREAGETAGEVADRTERGLKDLERKMDGIRSDATAAQALAERARSLAAGQAGTAERLARLERQATDLEEAVRLLREDLAVVATRRETPPAPEPPADSEGGGAAAGGKKETPPEETPAAGGAMPAPNPLSPEARRCIALLKDKDAGVRFSAAIELGKLNERAAWPALAETLRKDDDPFVRRACARSIGELKAYDAFPDLADALMDGEEYVAVQAARVIKEMAGQDFGFKQGQARADRRRVAERAKKWWEENKDRLAPGARD